MKIEWDRPILVGGAPSCGSTLLSVMLDAHPEILCGPELVLLAHPALYQSFGRYKKFLANHGTNAGYDTADAVARLEDGFCPYTVIDVNNFAYYGVNFDLLLSHLAESESPEAFLRKLFEPSLVHQAKRIWAEKSPPNLYAFRAFLERFPKGRVVYLVRDPRDQIVSVMRRGLRFDQALAIWLVETAMCESLHTHPRAFCVRFEDLVTDTWRVVEDLLRFLGIGSAIERMLNYLENSPRISNDPSACGMPTWRANPVMGFSRAPIGVGERRLTPFQKAALASAYIAQAVPGYDEVQGVTAAELIQRLDYPPIKVPMIEPQPFLEFCAREHLLVSGIALHGAIFQERFVSCDVAMVLGQSGPPREVLDLITALGPAFLSRPQDKIAKLERRENL
ncbi:MAG: sulfotransferase [Armatimonadetes bacterium]|nr:sulfotransferase [Armatimonadota bacterium]